MVSSLSELTSGRVPPRPVVKYYVYMGATSAGLMVPIWVIYLRSLDLSYTEILVLDAIWWVGIVVGEIPTGWVGDRIGWRNSLIAGGAIRVVAIVGMTLSDSVVLLATDYLVWALAATLQSGSRDAWLYELLDERLTTDDFTRVRGRGQSLTLAVGAVGSVAGGYLATYGLRIPFLATAALASGSVLALLTMPAVAVDPEDRPTVLEALPAVRERLTRPPLRGVVLWIAVIFGVAQAVARLTQPVSVDLGVPVGGLGWLYAAFTVAAAAASYWSDRLRHRIGLHKWLLLAPLALALFLGAAWVVPLAAFPAFFAVRLVRSATRPMANQYVNDRIESAGRATVLSGASMVYSLIAVPFSVAVGVAADAWSPLTAMGAVGAVLVGLTLTRRSITGPTTETETVPAD